MLINNWDIFMIITDSKLASAEAVEWQHLRRCVLETLDQEVSESRRLFKLQRNICLH